MNDWPFSNTNWTAGTTSQTIMPVMPTRCRFCGHYTYFAQTGGFPTMTCTCSRQRPKTNPSHHALIRTRTFARAAMAASDESHIPPEVIWFAEDCDERAHLRGHALWEAMANCGWGLPRVDGEA